MENEMNRNFVKGQIVILDADMANPAAVEVVSQTPLRKYTTVCSADSEWQVMTYRLSPVDE